MTYDMGGLKLAFWGLLFTAINIRIQGFDIVPDLVGYIMVIVGLGRIEHYEENFSLAKKLAYALAVLSLVNVYQAPVQNTVNHMGMMETNAIIFNAGIFGAVPWLATGLMIVAILTNLYFIYALCLGIKNLLNRVGDFALAKICDDRWKLIMATQIGLLVSLILVVLQIPFGTIMTILFGVLALIALVLFLLLIHHADKSIHGKEESIHDRR